MVLWRAVAPWIVPRPQQPELGALQHCSLGRTSSEELGRAEVQIGKFCSRATSRSPPQARALRGSHPFTICSDAREEGTSSLKRECAHRTLTVPPTWRARHHTPPATGAMHALHVCAHGGVIYICTGVGERFSCDPYPFFDLGKLFPQLWGVRGGLPQS